MGGFHNKQAIDMCIIAPHFVGQNCLTHYNKLVHGKGKMMEQFSMFVDGTTFHHM
jgi:hypothetical protein